MIAPFISILKSAPELGVDNLLNINDGSYLELGTDVLSISGRFPDQLPAPVTAVCFPDHSGKPTKDHYPGR
jgi:hypothetical protein